MNALVGAEYGQRYRPMVGPEKSGGGSPLPELKRLLSSRSKADVCKATAFVAELIQRCPESSLDRDHIINYLLNGDICVFLCDAMATLDWDIVRGSVSCLELMNGRGLVAQEHAAYAVSCTALMCTHCARTQPYHPALLSSLRLMTDIFIRVREYQLSPVICSTSIYNMEQLLGLLATLTDCCSGRDISLFSALLLHSIISYQPEGLNIGVKCAGGLAGALEKWLPLLCSAVTDACSADVQLFYGVVCHLAVNTLRLCGCITNCKTTGNFVQKIVSSSEEDVLDLKHQTKRLAKTVYLTALELVSYTKDNWQDISDEDYALFLQFLKLFLTDSVNAAIFPSFSEMLATNGYLSLLPKNRLIRNVREVNVLSVRSMGEILSHLCRQYLGTDSVPLQPGQYTLYMNNLQKELSDLPHNDVTKWPRSLSAQLCTVKPYSLLIYLYFHCLTTTSPDVTSAPLLPYLVEHIFSLPQSFQPPDHIVKCLWLVFAMSRMSNCEDGCLRVRVRTEQATRRLVQLISTRPALYYTHHPAILLCSFVSTTITRHVKRFTLSLWLERETSIPEELSSELVVVELLLEIIQSSSRDSVVQNAAAILKGCMLDQPDRGVMEKVGLMVWSSLPEALTKILQMYDCKEGVNLKWFVELAAEIIPDAIDPELYHKLARLITLVFTKMFHRGGSDVDELSYSCLKLAYFVLHIAKKDKDDRVPTILVNGTEFLQTVLVATRSSDVNVSCMALQFLSYIVYTFTSSNCQCDKELEIEPTAIATILHKEMNTPRGPAFLQLFYVIMSNANCERNIPINLGTGPTEEAAKRAMRVLLFRVQMICCKESREKSAIGWMTLNVMMKYIINYRRDNEAITMFATQPWMFTLVRFQLSQKIVPEFLAFVRSWLACLKIIFQRASDTGSELCKATASGDMQYSLFMKTLVFIRKAAARYDESGTQKPKILDLILELVNYFTGEKKINL